ncbi:DUF4262 domain-containing protein [Segetibacter aerophilus]|uniref:DUF4262 domain-containing protein n=1 Tax=Segetibacter aerophilus TaxID=670293 RepID=A0A512BC15_9BACT|nr:DUF4262 domain-containing protein [Segetibacter aerophilus]GEO09511.1 hypothetical protein SAE01_20070 [Segetibacter aerophilus]
MEKIKAGIEHYGWYVIQVLEDDNNPPFGYSIGLFETFGHPEVLIVGLKLELIHSLINIIGEQIRNGETFQESHFYSDILTNYQCYFTSVNPESYNDYVYQAINYYNESNFPLLQYIYPTVKGIYPWEAEWPEEIAYLQPILGKSPYA